MAYTILFVFFIYYLRKKNAKEIEEEIISNIKASDYAIEV